MKAMQHFVGADEQLKMFYSDNAPELLEAVKCLGWRHLTSLPHRPKTNGVVERQVRSVIEGTRALLLQAGMPAKWWSRACRCFCVLRNATRETASGR